MLLYCIQPRTSLTTLTVTVGLLLLAGTTLGANLIVSDPTVGKVFLYKATGTQRTFASVYYAEGLAFDTSGNLYVTDFNESIIYKFTPNRTQSIFASGIEIGDPFSIAFDTAGNLFVAHDGFESGIAKITPDGTVSSFVSVTNPGALAFDSMGNLFAAVGTTIVDYAVDGSGTTFASGFEAPAGLAFDSEGNLFVSDLLTGTIYELAPEGTKSTFVTGLGQPFGLAFDTRGNLFVADAQTGSILEFTPNGKETVFATGLNSPYFLAFQPRRR